MTTAIMETSRGTLNLEFYDEDAPGTVKNFCDLAKKGYYDGLTFHRVIPGFVVQGGCPKGDGTGGPGYTIKCETGGKKQYHDKGILSMAHAGPNTGGSQFFICLSRQSTQHLDRKHTCFGKVTAGVDLLDKIKGGDKIVKVTVQETVVADAETAKA